MVLLTLALLTRWEQRASAYTLLTHEELIDLTWQDSIVPLLLSQYPHLTPAQLDEARAYAYGGCVIQDMGYYPFGDRSFSNLTHYVRTGDFVVSLFRNAHSADELAFAVGALSHYIGDSVGHSHATNLAVPVEFPRLRRKYGAVVSYAEGEDQHVQTEFAFDIDEIAHHHMAPVRYLRHIGLKVPVTQLALAFYQTYGVSDEFSPRRRRFNVREYRFAVHAFFPRIAYAVTLLHRHDEPPEPDTAEAAEIAGEIAAVAARNDWQRYRRKAGLGTYLLAGLIFILPKIGPLRLVAVKGPTPATDADYVHSVALSVADMRIMLARFTPPSARRARSADAAMAEGPSDSASATQSRPANRKPIPFAQPQPADRLHPLPNRDLDTGYVVKPGGYSLTDSTYAHLLHRLTRNPTQAIPPGIKSEIQAYYANPNSPITTKKNAKKWARVQADLATLAAMRTSTAPEPYPTYGYEADSLQ
jgi:Zinc dependent phospholipase C